MNTAAEAIDFNQIAKNIVRFTGKYRAGSFLKIYEAMELLRELPFPPGYVDSLRDDALKVLQAGDSAKPTFVYLAFYGDNNKATHLKVGVAKDVTARLAGIRTGNPLPLLWKFTALYPSRRDAMAVESALLAHLSADSIHGEWVGVGTLSANASVAIVDSLSDVAETVSGYHIHFQQEGA